MKPNNRQETILGKTIWVNGSDGVSLSSINWLGARNAIYPEFLIYLQQVFYKSDDLKQLWPSLLRLMVSLFWYGRVRLGNLYDLGRLSPHTSRLIHAHVFTHSSVRERLQGIWVPHNFLFHLRRLFPT